MLDAGYWMLDAGYWILDMEKRWNICEVDEEKVKHLQESLRIHPLLCKLLVARGIETYEQSRDFFRPQLSQLHSPWLMKDMHKAVDRILLAIEKNEKILVYGDYDVDGTTSVATMFSFLRRIHS